MKPLFFVRCAGAWMAHGLLAALALLGGCAQMPLTGPAPGQAPGPIPDVRAEVAPQARPCPADLPAGIRCLGGIDRAGARYLIAMPPAWSGVLVLHAHGGPELGTPSVTRTDKDLQRWKVVLQAGHAWAGSGFRQGGVAVRAAAEDTERLRRIFVAQVAQPRRTLLHGQSWGAGVAAVGAEMYATAADGRSPYDAVLLSSGVLAGGTRSYDFRLDLRVIYQQLCGNHPRSDEPAYPLWMGLPPDAKLTRAELAKRVDECLGLKQPAAKRTAQQQQRLDSLLRVIRIPERSVQGHLNWATWHFQDIVQHRTGGLNPFGNRGAHYTGSDDDAALNRAVPRYAADPQAVARFAADTDPGGRIPVPVLTVHAVDDPTALVEMESTFRDVMVRAGTADHLVQTFTDDHEHSYLSDAAYATLMAAVLQWVDGGQAPTPASIARGCAAQVAVFGDGCRFLPGYQPLPLTHRVADRLRP